MAEWTVDAEALDSVAQVMEQYGAGAGQIIDSVLQTQGAQLIKEQIAMLLPASGRTWKGKPASGVRCDAREIHTEQCIPVRDHFSPWTIRIPVLSR